MVDKNSDEEKIVSLEDFKSKLKQKIEAKDSKALETAAPFENILAKQKFAIDALSSVLSYVVVEMYRVVETSSDPATVHHIRAAISHIDTAVMGTLHILKQNPTKNND